MKINSYELFNYQSFSLTLTEVWATEMNGGTCKQD